MFTKKEKIQLIVEWVGLFIFGLFIGLKAIKIVEFPWWVLLMPLFVMAVILLILFLFGVYKTRKSSEIADKFVKNGILFPNDRRYTADDFKGLFVMPKEVIEPVIAEYIRNDCLSTLQVTSAYKIDRAKNYVTMHNALNGKDASVEVSIISDLLRIIKDGERNKLI